MDPSPCGVRELRRVHDAPFQMATKRPFSLTCSSSDQATTGRSPTKAMPGRWAWVNGSRDEMSGAPSHSHAPPINCATCNSDEPSSRFAAATMTTRPDGDVAIASTHSWSTPVRFGSGGRVHLPPLHLSRFGPNSILLIQTSLDLAASDDSAIASCGSASGVSDRQHNSVDAENWACCASKAAGAAATAVAIKIQRIEDMNR